MISMKTNIFNVKEKKEKRIIIEEERTKNPLLLFWRRFRKIGCLMFISLLVCLLLVSVGFAFSLVRGSNDYDITYINGDEEIEANNNPSITDDDVKNELLGEIARSEGVVLLVESFMSPNGDVISYYSDGTSIIILSDGTIYRVSPKNDGNYGVDRDGKIIDGVKKILVTSSTSSLMNGAVITYYSDGTAKVEMDGKTIFVRDSNNIHLDNGSNFSYTNPSGVAMTGKTDRLDGNDKVISFTDGTHLIYQGDKKILVNKNTSVSVQDNHVVYDANNTFSVIGEKLLDDGNTVTHFSNGSAIITDKNGNVIYVKKSGDIVQKNNKIYEIITNPYGFSRSEVKTGDGKTVIYYDNGGAVIIYPDGNRQYVPDNTEILYDGNKNITSVPTTASLLNERKTANGDQVFNFDNGKSQVIKSDGTSYIVDTDKLVFLPSGNITKEPVDVKKNQDKNKNKDKKKEEEDPGADIYISEAENKYSNDIKNIEDTTFIIRNDGNKAKTLRITIIEVSNYKKYNTVRLAPSYVKFQATVGDEYVTARPLTSKNWKNSNGVTNYVIYDGTIPAKTAETVAISLYVDYAELTNLHQDTGFIGTINIYVDG